MNKYPAKYKQISFDTAIRSPERCKGILEVISKFEDKILDNDNLLDILCFLYIDKVLINDSIFIGYKSTPNDIKNAVIDLCKKRKGDGGFPKGYQARFWTLVRTLAEFGFVYARYNQKLLLSDMAKMWLKGDLTDHDVFAIQTMKYNRTSPYRRVLNDYNYFKFLIEVLLELNIRNEYNNAIDFYQLIITMYAKTDNVVEFLNLINNYYLDYNSTLRYIRDSYEDINHEKTIMKDYPDILIRLLRMTDLITISSSDIQLFSINQSKIDLIRELLAVKFELTEEEKDNEYLFFKKLDTQNDEYIKIVKKYRNTH